MVHRFHRRPCFPWLAALLAGLAAIATSVGCTALVRQPGAGLLRSKTDTAAFREAVEKDRGVPSAAEAGVAPCE